ncbi:phage antirepressor protein [Candidatus Berkelbacteria bacterium RIFCSPLOWO2_01_FULL_50_28]|uniref:Phage antirepressor protein n=1 Tax=Candidatus Berkelbacteria bacterium RIFCSPLOWO2_01_FULL_50_28 TaxID=1797471 RepID=A0A1F5EAH7_9BACT|nr:MAG: phage antirepressor protein [Candidatus Berkelbacteria bacterium RIFCSPHIGHO2_12_FULL_50_11]OGD64254.1 MAG: phage antirepressor protein [Candidatus Berkelbacteria bacterium RIFCSPLOWO2_01_FULL_50_28]
MGDELNKIAIFQKKEVRKVIHKNEWWFVINDIIVALTDSANPAQYLKNIRNRDIELNSLFEPVEKGGVQIEPPLALSFDTPGGKQKLLCWHTEGIFRLVQSIPSPKAEPFKRWLAKVGYERVQEIEDPELAQKRMKALYKAKGYSDGWIEKRVRGIVVRGELTDEWQKRGVQEGREYSILTAEISRAAFGVTPSEYKKLKGLERENLRDHMTDLELIFSMLGEASTTEIAREDDAQGFDQNKDAAIRGGGVAGQGRKQLEKETNKKVISPANFKEETRKLEDNA